MCMSSEEFWNLSYYEWCLSVLRFNYKKKSEREREEGEWVRTRILWATMINIHCEKKVQPTDLIKFDFDLKLDEQRAGSIPDDAFEQITKKWGKTLNETTNGNQ